MEKPEVKLAKIEAGIESLHEKLDLHHKYVSSQLVPLQKKVDRHEVSIAVLKRDRWWLFTIAGLLGAITSFFTEKMGK